MNKNFYKHIFILITFLVTIGLLSFNKLQEDKRIKVNNEMSLILSTPNLEMDELLTSLKEINENIIFLRSISKLKSKPVLFAVSRYENSEPVKLSSAFYEQTVNQHPTNLEDISENHKVISFREYIKGNKTLYTKVSKPFEGQCNIMYYLMKDNFSKVMYEIKLSGKLSEKEEMEFIAEKIALTVEIL